MFLLVRSTLLTAMIMSAGCAHQPASKSSETTTASSTKTAENTPAKAKENRPEGEIVGTPAKNSKFAKLKIGQTYRQVSELIGAPDDLTRHETGKRWIPFYYGGDAQRMEVYYKGEGCLTYTGGNVFGGGGNELLRINVDPKGTCWR